MNKQYYKSNRGNETYLQNTIAHVLTEVYELMKVCYGPYGSHVLIANNIAPEAMKDGQKILSSFNTDSTISTTVRQSILNVSNKQVEEVGDGSTTTILLLCKLYEGFRKLITEYHIAPSVFMNEVSYAVSLIKEGINNKTKYLVEDDKITDNGWNILYDAIYTSVDGNKSLADTIISMFKELNTTDPFILVDTSSTSEHRYELVKGVEIDGAPIAPQVFYNNFSRKEVNSPKIVVINGRLDLSVEQIMDFDTYCMQTEQDYIFLCDGIDDDKLKAIIDLHSINPASFNRLTLFRLKMTAQNSLFLDMCASLGTTPIDSETLSKCTSNTAVRKVLDISSGTCAKSLMTEFCARFNDPKSDEDRIKERIETIDSAIEDLKNDPTSHNDVMSSLLSRKAFLNKHHAKLYVGGVSPQRRSINYELAKDAVLQGKNCLLNGVVDGCNTVVLNVLNDIDAYDIPEHAYAGLVMEVIGNAYYEVLLELIKNKETDNNISKDIIETCFKSPEGSYVPFNLRNNDATPVINSAKTDKTILENATDMAVLLATTKAFLSSRCEFDSVNI